MARETYQRSLEALHDDVVELGRKVLAQFGQGLDALVRNDRALAARLNAADDVIDDETLRIEKECVDLVALQQPVAGDMRLITASFKIVTDLERIADLAVNLGDYSGVAETLDMVSPEIIDAIGRLDAELLAAAMRAYAERDAEAAEAVIRRDQDVDDLTWGTIRSFIKQLYLSERQSHDEAEAERIAAQALPILLSMRDLERVADHAANIAGRVVYLATGRHERF
jgi:phosphate transport system protein